MLIPDLGLIALAGQYEVGFQDTPALWQSAGEQLEKSGLHVIRAEDVMYDGATVARVIRSLQGKPLDLFCVCVGTWSEDHHLLDLLDHFDVPVILWAFPGVETGSLCGVQQICCVLKELDKPYFFVYGQPDDDAVVQEILEISMAAALANRLKQVKIGTIGGRIKGMTEIAFDELELKARTGVRIVNLDEDELITAYNSADAGYAAEYWHNMKQKAGKVTASDNHGIESVRYYLAMRSLINDYSLEGLCIKCYPKFMGKICLGYSLLSEEGMVCGCEGDVNNTVAMKILYELTRQPVHNTDLLYPDPGLNTILFSHCGSGGFSLANTPEDIHLDPVRLANSGVCALFPAKPGKVTLVNLVGRRGTLRMSVLVGDAQECAMEFPGNPLKVRLARPVQEINRQIAVEGIGHHWMGGYGDVTRMLGIFCHLKGIRLITL